jgi:hypothetical protein
MVFGGGPLESGVFGPGLRPLNLFLLLFGILPYLLLMDIYWITVVGAPKERVHADGGAQRSLIRRARAFAEYDLIAVGGWGLLGGSREFVEGMELESSGSLPLVAGLVNALILHSLLNTESTGLRLVAILGVGSLTAVGWFFIPHKALWVFVVANLAALLLALRSWLRTADDGYGANTST